MKKLLFLTTALVLLGGCFAPRPAHIKVEPDTAVQSVTIINGDGSSTGTSTEASSVVSTPSLADGDIYLDALGTKDKVKCQTIQNEKLKVDCVEQVSKN